MAPSQPTRIAKPCNQWTADEFVAYHIKVVHQNFANFFEMPMPPEPTINPNILTTVHWSKAPDPDTADTLKFIDLVTTPVSSGETSMVDFADNVLRALRYPRPRIGWFLRSRFHLSPLVICGKEKQALINVCLTDRRDIALLLIQEVKGDQDPHAPLVAKAIAAFMHNRTHMEARGLPLPQSTVIAGITLKGSTPTFYKIPISMELATAVRQGVRPESPTIVYAHVPDVPGSPSEGMRPLDNRRVILSCFEAFKKFIS